MQANIREDINASHYWPFVKKIHSDRWFPLTQGLQCGIYFPVMNSSRNAVIMPSLPILYSIMTSSKGNIFRVTGHLCGEVTGPGEFPAQRPVTRSFDVFFDLSLNERLSKQSRGWWFETQSRPLWRHCNVRRKKDLGSVYEYKTLHDIFMYT